MEETDVNIGQLRRPACNLHGEKERGDRGPAPRRSAADAAPKKNGDQAKRARATYTWSHDHEASVDRALHGERSWEHGHGRGTPYSWTIIERTENDLDVDLGTCGCVDHRQNFGPQSVESINKSVESINTSAAHSRE